MFFSRVDPDGPARPFRRPLKVPHHGETGSLFEPGQQIVRGSKQFGHTVNVDSSEIWRKNRLIYGVIGFHREQVVSRISSINSISEENPGNCSKMKDESRFCLLFVGEEQGVYSTWMSQEVSKRLVSGLITPIHPICK